MSADYPAAEEHFVPRNFMFNSNAHVAVVIHKTGGDATPQAVYNTFINSGNPGKSSHYAIGMDGSIWQFVPEALGAGANGITDATTEAFWYPCMQQYGNLNTCTISIEHCDPSRNNDTPLTAAQKQASFALVAHLCQKYGIPADHIKPHRSIVSTACPGTYPMQELQDFIAQGGNTSMIPNGWTDDGTTLKDPNGFALTGAVRTNILSSNWQADNVVVGTLRFDQPGSSVLLEDGRWGNGDLILFERSAIAVAWKPDPALTGGAQQTGVTFLVPTGNELLWARRELNDAHQQIVSLQAEIAALKAQPPTGPVDTTALVASINAIADGVAKDVAVALVEAKKL